MNATCPNGGSFTFRSIIHGRELLREGIVWRVGNGASIKIHHDNWIPRQGSLQPLGQQFIPGITQIRHLLNEPGDAWDMDKLQLMFTPGDIEDIRHIVVGGPNMQDYMAWNFTKNGEFTVKSAYHFGLSLRDTNTG